MKRTMWGTVDTNALSDWVLFYGCAPEGAVSVRYVWQDGRVEKPIEVDRHRYFLAFLPYNSRNNEKWMQEHRTEALDADGKVIAVVYSNR